MSERSAADGRDYGVVSLNNWRIGDLGVKDARAGETPANREPVDPDGPAARLMGSFTPDLAHPIPKGLPPNSGSVGEQQARNPSVRNGAVGRLRTIGSFLLNSRACSGG